MATFAPGDRVEKFQGAHGHPNAAPIGARGTVVRVGVDRKGVSYLVLKEWPGGTVLGHVAENWRVPMLHCSAKQAWTLMRTGLSLTEVARLSHDDPVMLDAAVWAYRAAVTTSRMPKQVCA